MSRAISFRFSESARMRIMAEEGLEQTILAEMRGDIGTPATVEIHGNLEDFQMREMQVDVPSISQESLGDKTLEIRFVKRGVMTFIEIIIPDKAGDCGHDLDKPGVSKAILVENAQPENIHKETTDEVDFGNVSFPIPDLLEFSLEPGLKDVIKSLEVGQEDFSLSRLEGVSDVFKSLPAHEDQIDFKDLMNELRKREKVKVRAAKSH